MNYKSIKNSPSLKQTGIRFNCAINLELLKKSTRMALLKMKYQVFEESDRMKIRKRSLIFAKNQLESEKKISPPKKVYNLEYHTEKKMHKNQSTHSSNENIMMQSKSMISKYSKQLDNVNYGNPSIFSQPSKQTYERENVNVQKSIFPQRKLVRKQRAETQYTINSSINQPSPSNAKIEVKKLIGLHERFGSSGWEVEPSDDL